MIASDVLERPGVWRTAVMALALVLALTPAIPLLFSAMSDVSQTTGLSDFATALVRSLSMALAVSLIAVLLGTPAGLLTALYDIPGRHFFLAIFALPLLVPSFLWAIGLSQLRIFLGLQSDSILSGWSGTLLVSAVPASSLVLYLSWLATSQLPRSQIEALRIIDGEPLLLRQTARAVLPASVLGGLLAGALTLSDPGPGQILGFSGVPYEILVSFSALYDFNLAAKQCLFPSVIVLLVSLPAGIFLAPRVADEMTGRSVASTPLSRNTKLGTIAFFLLSGLVAIGILGPIIGLLRPLIYEFPISRSLDEVSRTWANTFFYAFGAGILATVLGFVLAVAVGRDRFRRRILFVGLFAFLSIPPTLSSLGFIKIASTAPSWLDLVLRSRLTVLLALALRFSPIATLIAVKAFGSTSPSHAQAAGVHGISLVLYFRRILVPLLTPAALLSTTVVALLATAEVGTVLLLRPPGEDSLPVQIFTIMANAPESLVAGLCFMYLAGAVLLMAIGWRVFAKGRAA